MEHGADNASVVGLIPYGPFTSELDLIVLVDTFQLRIFCDNREVFLFALRWVGVNDKVVLQPIPCQKTSS